jgi:hypothetical protein
LEHRHEGDLKIGEAVIPCAVLDTKQRVLTQSGVMKALGRARQAKGRSYYDGDVNLPAFITAKNLKPFIPNDLYVTSTPAMAAGVSDRLWEVSDIVGLLEAAEPKLGKRGPYKKRASQAA